MKSNQTLGTSFLISRSLKTMRWYSDASRGRSSSINAFQHHARKGIRRHALSPHNSCLQISPNERLLNRSIYSHKVRQAR